MGSARFANRPPCVVPYCPVTISCARHCISYICQDQEGCRDLADCGAFALFQFFFKENPCQTLALNMPRRGEEEEEDMDEEEDEEYEDEEEDRGSSRKRGRSQFIDDFAEEDDEEEEEDEDDDNPRGRKYRNSASSFFDLEAAVDSDEEEEEDEGEDGNFAIYLPLLLFGTITPICLVQRIFTLRVNMNPLKF